MKILILDIETSPNLAYVWGCWKQNVASKQMLDNTEIMSVSWKWLGEDAVFYIDTRKHTEKYLLKKLNKVLDKADAVVGHNVKAFDMKHIRGRSLINGLKPTSPYKEIDTLLAARKEFKFSLNSLEHLAKILGLTPKSPHKKFPGFELWEQCLKGNKEAWEEMKEYNIQDIITTEEVYLALRPYMRNHPNVAIFLESEEVRCPKCGSDDYQRRGSYYTNAARYQRYRCNSCGGWHRGRYTDLPKEQRKVLPTNAI